MGLRDALTGRHTIKQPAAERLFALSTAYVTLESAHQITSSGAGAIVFQPLATSDFDAITHDLAELVRATGSELGASVAQRDDSYGYHWTIVKDQGLEDLVVAIHAVSSGLEAGGYGDRVLCAVFRFTGASSERIYLIYNYKRGSWYPFVPGAAPGTRHTERELQIKAQIGMELPIEAEIERWFPLWGIPV